MRLYVRKVCFNSVIVRTLVELLAPFYPAKILVNIAQYHTKLINIDQRKLQLIYKPASIE